ncbi:MAG: formylglycine-generating enzyme family protein [Anaerolineales bacterium]|nr:formylglycine-generating enzyme family protein [Anaerolineales bacterium]
MKRSWLIWLVLILTACGSSTAQVTTVGEYIDTGIDPGSWVLIPAGAFPEGQHSHLADLDYSYQIMVTDVTNQQYAGYINEAISAGVIQSGDVEVVENEKTTIRNGIFGSYSGDPFDGYEHEDPIEAGYKLHLPLEGFGEKIKLNGQDASPTPELANHPVTMVTWFGAQAYCEFYGWRLPTELEWEKAARGTDLIEGNGLAFPWGDEIQSNQANFYSSHDLIEKISGKLGGTTPVGFYNGSSYEGFQTEDQASPYGLYDMAGNVWQWTGDDYARQHYRYLRGGSFYSYEVDLRVWKRNSAGPTFFAPDVGFRCARDE